MSDLLTARTVEVQAPVNMWEGLVERVGGLLVGTGNVEPRYVAAMKRAVREHGPYMVIAPRIALLHAHPRDGARRVCMSLVTPKTPISFGHPYNDPVDVAVGLGTTDDRSHLRALREIMELLSHAEVVDQIARCHSTQDLLTILGCFDQMAV